MAGLRAAQSRVDYLGQAREKREQAARARRLALGVTSQRDFDVLRALAASLEAEARALEQRARLPREVPQVQEQAQQRRAIGADDKSKESSSVCKHICSRT
jgi:hypothetical protein